MSDSVSIPVTLHHETRDAWLVSKDGRRQAAKWVPKAWGAMAVTGTRATLTLPRARANEKGLL